MPEDVKVVGFDDIAAVALAELQPHHCPDRPATSGCGRWCRLILRRLKDPDGAADRGDGADAPRRARHGGLKVDGEKRIHLVFKTHLDIGFTDHAAKVRRQYHERFIPQAIETGEHFFAEDPERPKFVWTTGAWLIWDHLNARPPAEVARLERAIERGLIRWHALPFTTHSELMSPDLFRAGLSFCAGARPALRQDDRSRPR